MESFSPEIRLTSASLGYDLAHAVCGGFAPLLATALFTNVGLYAPGLIYSLFGFLSVCGIYLTYFCGGGGGAHQTTTSQEEEEATATQTNDETIENNSGDVELPAVT